MAQDITKISPAMLQLQLHKLNLGTLKQLFEGLSQYLTEKGNWISDDDIIKHERKRTMLIYEMKRRMATGKMPVEFAQWENNIYRKVKKKFGGFGKLGKPKDGTKWK